VIINQNVISNSLILKLFFLCSCVKVQNIKKMKIISGLIESNLSFEKLLNFQNDFQKLKSVIFEERILEIFDSLPKYQLKHLRNLVILLYYNLLKLRIN